MQGLLVKPVLMKSKTILILGGYGQVGTEAARLLLLESGADLLIAGRNRQKAEQTATALNRQFPGERVKGACCDAADRKSLEPLFREARLVLVCSSTAKHTHLIAETAISCGTDYMDIHFGAAVFNELKKMEPAIKKAGRCFITGGGFHPGLPALLIRYAAGFFDEILSARVAGLMNIDFSSYRAGESTQEEFVDELADYQGRYYKKGRWKKMNMLTGQGIIKAGFGKGYGNKYCAPFFLEELRSLPQLYPQLKDCGFFIAGFNRVTDYFIMPLVMLGHKILPVFLRPSLSRLLTGSMKKYSRPPYGYVLTCDAEGRKYGQQKKWSLRMEHQDPSFITAVPVVAFLKQYLSGETDQPGLWLQAMAAEPRRMIQDMGRMGLKMIIKESGK